MLYILNEIDMNGRKWNRSNRGLTSIPADVRCHSSASSIDFPHILKTCCCMVAAQWQGRGCQQMMVTTCSIAGDIWEGFAKNEYDLQVTCLFYKRHLFMHGDPIQLQFFKLLFMTAKCFLSMLTHHFQWKQKSVTESIWTQCCYRLYLSNKCGNALWKTSSFYYWIRTNFVVQMVDSLIFLSPVLYVKVIVE